jgi:aspartyl-tRNA(Asn)/glutamyl-tRNA(Gln) amidotransferase subunit A
MALGTDTGGSVRIPASLCGITGLKTTVGRISRQGVYPLSESMDSVGPITRTAGDAALVYQYLHGPDPDDQTTLDKPLQNVLDTLKSNIKGLRLAIPDSLFFEEIDPEVKKSVIQASKIFTHLGAQVVSIEFPEADMARELNRNGLIIAAEAYTVNQDLLEEHFDDLDHVVVSRMINGKKISASEYIMNKNEWEKLRKQTIKRLCDTDALLVPTTPIPALPVEEIDKDLGTYLKKNNTYLRNTSIGNILNLCGLTIPCGTTANGLPVGLMIYGKPFEEHMVLRVGYAFQKATQWHNQTPNLEWIS